MNEEARTEIQAKTLAEVHKYLAHVDQNLNGKDYITGKNFTVADCPLVVNLGCTKFAEIDLSAYKNIPACRKRGLEEEGMKDMFPA